MEPLLRRTAAAVAEAFEPQQVYVCLWSHAGGEPGHIHWVVQPAWASTDEKSRGPHLQAAMFDRGESPDPAGGRSGGGPPATPPGPVETPMRVGLDN